MKNKLLLITTIISLYSFNSLAQVHTLGERYGGGIVFYVSENGQHGLIAATADQSTGIQWYNGVYKFIADTIKEEVGAGAKKTKIIVAAQMKDKQNGNFAAKVCADYSVIVDSITYNDWYLPSIYELNLLRLQKDTVGGFTNYYGETYWSSSEDFEKRAATQTLCSPNNKIVQIKTTRNWDKSLKNRVRAIRAF